MSLNPIQPTSRQNPQNTAVGNQSVVQFKDLEVVNKEDVCFKDLPEKVSGGFSFSRSIGRIWNVVKEGVSAFFRKLFGRQPEVSADLARVGMRKVANEDNRPSSVPAKNMPKKKQK